MSGSILNDTNVTEESMFDEEWLEYRSKVLKGFQIIEIIILSIAIWVLFSVVIYGTKTGRWRKSAQTSSLNNGLIFIAGVVTLLAYIPRLSATMVMYIPPRSEDEMCDFIFDFGAGSFTVAIWGSYSFMWVRQRMIYNHPYVKPHVAKWVNWLSISTILLLTVNALGVGFTQIQQKSYYSAPPGCIYRKQKQEPGDASPEVVQISLLAFLLFQQLVITALFVYPAQKVLLQQRRNEIDSPVPNLSGRYDMSKSSTWMATFMCCGNSNAPTSPIQMSVRRTMGCSLVMVLSEIIITVVDLPLHLPGMPTLSETLYDIGLVIHAVCIVMTFSFASNVLTLFWPKCQIRVISRKLSQRARESNPGYEGDKSCREKQVSNA